MLYLNQFLDKINGKWYSHQTVYFIQQKQINSYKGNKNIVLNLQQSINYLLRDKLEIKHNKDSINYTIVHENLNHFILNTTSIDNYSNYQLCLLNDNCIKILSTCKINNINYIEYIYCINKNFRISVIFLKQEEKYVAISFNSCIRNIN